MLEPLVTLIAIEPELNYCQWPVLIGLRNVSSGHPLNCSDLRPYSKAKVVRGWNDRGAQTTRHTVTTVTQSYKHSTRNHASRTGEPSLLDKLMIEINAFAVCQKN